MQNAHTQAQPADNKIQPDTDEPSTSPQDITHYIETRAPYLEPTYQLHQLAKALQTNSKQLSQTINQDMHMNFFELINGYRVKKAQQLLAEQTSLPIIEVMLQSGFQTKSAFNRVFKQQTSATPSQYRTKHAKSQ